MNAQRRETIAAAIAALRDAANAVASARDLIEQAGTDERDYFDNMPESLQGGEKGERADEVASTLESALDDVANLDIESIIGELETAAE